MNLTEIPPTFRYILHAKLDYAETGATVWQCGNCALRSIPIGHHMYITDRIAGRVLRITRQHETRFRRQQVLFNPDGRPQDGASFREFSIPSAYLLDGMTECLSRRAVEFAPRPTPFGRGSDDVQELATVASVERFLYPNGGDAQ